MLFHGGKKREWKGMLKIALCDDDLFVYKTLKECVASFSIRYNIECKLKYFSTSKELLESPFDYNVLFLDIMLENGTDGIEIGCKLRKKDSTAIIHILTSRKDRLQDGYQATVMRYILKPIEQHKIDEALLASANFFDGSKRIFKITYNQKTTYVDYRDIIYAESYKRKRFIYTPLERLQTVENWDSICERLNGYEFFLPQRYIIINFTHIKDATKLSITMKNGKVIKFTKGIYDDFNTKFNEYLRMTL